jgi:methionine--tRNA ligase beta chain
VFKLPEPLIDESVGRIVGTDGERKMSKSLGNVIEIFSDYGVIERQIKSSFTDPNRKSATDKGTVEGNPVFLYHDLWNENKEEVAELKARYQAGEVGDVEVKEKLLAAHKKYFADLRAKKEYYEAHPEEVEKVLARGKRLASEVAEKMLAKVQKTCGLSSEIFEKKSGEVVAEIGIDDFAKVEMRVGLVTAASEPEWSNKLIKQEVDFGKLGKRVIFSGLRQWYTAADFVGKKLVYVTNLAPRKMGDELSEGMILAAEDENGVPQRWEITGAEPGQRVG